MPFHFSFIPFLLTVIVMVVVSLATKPASDKVIKETEAGMWF